MTKSDIIDTLRSTISVSDYNIELLSSGTEATSHWIEATNIKLTALVNAGSLTEFFLDTASDTEGNVFIGYIYVVIGNTKAVVEMRIQTYTLWGSGYQDEFRISMR